METELQVKTFLASEPAVSCALIMVDTDNFKHVNDTNGHLYGDAVLSGDSVRHEETASAERCGRPDRWG